MSEPATPQTGKRSFQPSEASWIANKTPEDIITHCSYGYGTVTRRSDALTRGLTLLKRMTPEEQQELRKTVSNRPKSFHVYSTLIKF